MSVPPPALPAALPATSKAAVASLICGIAGFLTGPLTGIPAIITGHIGLNNVRRSHGTLGGGGMALTGTILGYVTTFLIGGLAILAGLMAPLIIRQRHKAEQAMVISRLRQIGSALAEFEADHHQFPNDGTLAEVKTTPGVESGQPLSQLRSLTDMDELLSGPKSLQGEWYYFPGLKSGGKDVLVISPGVADSYQELLTDQTTRTVTLQQAQADISAAKTPPVNTPVRHKR